MRLAKLLLVAGLALLTASCTPPYKKAFDSAASEHHWTHKQELAAYAYADRIFWAKEVKEGTGQYVFIYSRVPVAKVADQIDKTLNDFDQIQSPAAQDWRKYAEVYNLKQDFLHEEDIERTIYARVHAADLENQFKVGMGDQSGNGPEADVRNGYDIKRIFVNKPLNEAFPFRSDEIDGAKKNGTLKEIEHADFNLGSTYDHKDVDPDHPDDANEFIWKPKTVTIHLTNYKIIDTEKPLDNHGNYIEGSRVIDGTAEPVPCLKIFFPPDGSMAIVLLETTREGEPGYGVPDVLQRLDDVEDLTAVIRDGSILNQLFSEKKVDARKIAPPKLFKIEISPLDQPISAWQEAPDENGWLVPLRYKSVSNDNYNVRIKYKDVQVDINDTRAVAAAHEGFRDIEWIEEEYTKAGSRYVAAPGQVIEYYRPMPAFATHVKAQVVTDDDTKKVEFQFPDGTVTTVMITSGPNKVIEGAPEAIAYTEGGKRYWIEKQHGSAQAVYNRRKQVSPPHDATGTYTDDDSTDTFTARPSDAGPTEGKKP